MSNASVGGDKASTRCLTDTLHYCTKYDRSWVWLSVRSTCLVDSDDAHVLVRRSDGQTRLPVMHRTRLVCSTSHNYNKCKTTGPPVSRRSMRATFSRGAPHFSCFFFFQAEDGIRDLTVTGVQTCALPI